MEYGRKCCEEVLFKDTLLFPFLIPRKKLHSLYEGAIKLGGPLKASLRHTLNLIALKIESRGCLHSEHRVRRTRSEYSNEQ